MNRKISKKTVISILISLIVLVPIVSALADPPIVVPKGMVTFSFDDGWVTSYTMAYPQMKAYGYKGDIDVITNDTGQQFYPPYGYASWSQIQTMVNSGWDACSHSVSHPDFNTLNASQINYQLQASQQMLLGNLTGNKGYRFWCQPYDDYNPTNYTQQISKYYDMACLSETTGNNMVNPPLQYNIDRYCISNTTTLTQIKNEISYAIANSVWLIIICHIITPSNAFASTYMLNSTFANMLSYVHKENVPVVLLSYVYDTYVAPPVPTPSPTVKPTSTPTASPSPSPTPTITPTPSPTPLPSGNMTAEQWADYYRWNTNGSALQNYKKAAGIG